MSTLNEDLWAYITTDQRKTDFRFWHVESLLNQAVDLLEQCLQEESQYRSLLLNLKNFELDLQAEEDSISLEEKKKLQGHFHRDKVSLDIEADFLQKSDGDFNDSVLAAGNAYKTSTGGYAEKSRFEQTVSEKAIESKQRKAKADKLVKEDSWAAEDEANINDQIAIRRALYKHKLEYTKVGGPLDLSKPLEAIEARLKQNYKDAYDRLTVAKDGLELIYPYKQSDFFTRLKDENIISSLAIWNRKAIEWLVAYQQLDQGFTRVISVRSLLSEEEWNNVGNLETLLNFPKTYFDSHKNVRLRGIGASIIGKAGAVPWAMTVKIPKMGLYKRKPDFDDTTINQSNMPMCFLGRVENRNKPVPIEICGIISLMNASPIGDEKSKPDEASWSIKIHGPSNNSEKLSDIDDILLEIRAVGHPVL